MTTEMALTSRTASGPARRLATVLAAAGIAAFASVAVAPAASAAPAESAAPVAQDGPAKVVHRSGGNGPDAFIVLEHGKKPVFYCDVDKPKKHEKKCLDMEGPRF